MNLEKLKENFKVYCLNRNNQLIDNDLAIDYEINHNGVFIELISIEEGSCGNCDEYDFYIVDNDFYNELTEYIIITPTEKINLPVGDDSELEYFHFGVKIKKDKLFTDSMILMNLLKWMNVIYCFQTIQICTTI